MKRLVLIHGRDQFREDPITLKQLWIDSLNKGLAENKLTLPADVEIVFPFYGKLLHELTEQAEKGAEHLLTAKGEMTDEEIAFFHDYTLEVAMKLGISTNDILKEYDGVVIEKGFKNWGLVLAAMRLISHHTGTADYIIMKSTLDAFYYLTLPAFKRRINEFVLNHINEQPSVVVAHSLGSVIGYNILRANPNLHIKGFLTIGSPLAIKSFKTKLDMPLKMPTCIKGQWYNAFDKHDTVSLYPLTKSYFDIDPEITNNNNITNHTKNKHGIEGYLDNKDVAKFIYDRLFETN